MILRRKSTLFLGSLLAGVFLVCLMFIDATVGQRIDRNLVKERREIVRILALTDLCLFTEARYTRHPSMADMHTPFQDSPLTLEHFPSGSIMAPPPHLQLRVAR